MILILDNFDSFTYNLYQQVLPFATSKNIAVQVIRNNVLQPHNIHIIKPNALIISPGPGNPDNTGNCRAIVNQLWGTVPILGVCLGHQLLAHMLKANIIPAKHVLHGKTSIVKHSKDALFKNIPESFRVARYHSLAVDRETLSDDWTITAATDDDEIMAIAHNTDKVWGIQFHPESFLTEHGDQIIENFIDQIELS
ncbi:MAG: aminodeoxychorismate/anthranilate synthase component II [Deltaproteobacteria bacterium]|nr:aminodeoxychorismate/anthranilate synthase component II [Deltaproteobacteria bacterium]